MAAPESPAKHDLSQYLEEMNLTLAQDYAQIQRRVKEDPGTAGDQAEETWAGVLRRWLPGHYYVVTKGRILGSDGVASPQIDVLVLWPSYPPFLLDKKLYMASGVAAAFECKLTLGKRHLRKLFETAVTLSEITEKEHANRKNPIQKKGLNYAYEEYHRIFEYGLLAHSFEGDDVESVGETLNNEITSLDRELVRHPKEMVDLICCHDLGSWVSERYAITSNPIVDTTANTYTMQYMQHPTTGYHLLTEKSWAAGTEIHTNFSPLGSFLSRLYRKLSRVDSSLLQMSKFFTHSLSTGQGGGKGFRLWTELKTPDDIWNLSAPLRAKNDSLMHDFSFIGF